MGYEEGSIDGLSDGELLGLSLGEDEGSVKGLSDGALLALSLGDADGSIDGSSDGVSLGLSLTDPSMEHLKVCHWEYYCEMTMESLKYYQMEHY